MSADRDQVVLSPPIPPALAALAEKYGARGTLLGHIALRFQRTLFNTSFDSPPFQTLARAAERITDRLEQLRSRPENQPRRKLVEAWASVAIMPAPNIALLTADDRRVLADCFESRRAVMSGPEFSARLTGWTTESSRWLAGVKVQSKHVHTVVGPYWRPFPPTVQTIMDFDLAHLETLRKPEATTVRDREPYSYSLFVARREICEAVGLRLPAPQR